MARSKSVFDLEEWQETQLLAQVETRHVAAIPENNRFRQLWNVVLVILLVYVGTLLPYFVSFYELRIGEELPDGNVRITYWIVDTFFYIDLVLNFVFTYEDSSGEEIFDLRKIAKRYLKGRFLLDVIACMPAVFWGVILKAFEAKGSMSNGGVYKLTRLARLQRASRLTRMASMSRFVDRFSSRYPFFALLKGVTCVRIINFAFTLFWFVHMLACGWYLCAALHRDPMETWVNRRLIDSEGTPLVAASPGVQWVNAMYFVLTVFTTVGFGDIAAVTSGEIVYVCFTMLVGAVVHSIIVSEMIGVVTAMDVEQKEASRRLSLVDNFASNVDLDDAAREGIKTWLRKQAKRGNLGSTFDRDLARSVFLDGAMPSDLLHDLPNQVFRGKLLESSLLKVLWNCSKSVPPRLVITLALSIHRRQCYYAEEIYKADDFASAIYLVEDGLFALVTRLAKQHALTKSLQAQTAPQEPERLPGEALPAPVTQVSWMRDSLGNMGATMLAHVSDKDRQQVEPSEATQWAPYKIFAKGAYFGEVELFINKPRRATTRCESVAGALFILNASDFHAVAETWPQYRRVWQAEAARRKKAQEKALKRRLAGSLEEAAARMIQAFWLERKGRRPPTEVSTLSPRRRTDVGDILRQAALPDGPTSVDTTPCGKSGKPADVAEGHPVGSPNCACFRASCGPRTSRQDGAVEALRDEMRESITELRAEILQEIRQGFMQLRNESSPAAAGRVSIAEHFC